jgi:hypothetical protein
MNLATVEDITEGAIARDGFDLLQSFKSAFLLWFRSLDH